MRTPGTPDRPRRRPRRKNSAAMTARGGPGRVLLGVCGSIAAYKSCELVRGLVATGAEVKVVMTESASRFVAPFALSVLSRGPVCRDMFDPGAWDVAHIALASWADLVLVAPATADFLARLAGGRCGGLLEALVLSTRAPVALCPAMDAEMWEHPATRRNAASLREFGYHFWGPEHGPLAGGKVGPGRLMAPAFIVKRAVRLLNSHGVR